MANPIFMYLAILLVTTTFTGNAISDCNGPCNDLNDCSGQLICINGKCGDDPDVGTSVCEATCAPSTPLTCGTESYTTYSCSPPVTDSTAAILTLNDFSQGGDGGAASSCDEKFHANSELVVALSTGWFDGRSRCLKNIIITASNGNSVTAKVVDECDSMHGCDEEHAGQPPCDNNIVDGSAAVWNALGIDQDLGRVDVNWSMA